MLKNLLIAIHDAIRWGLRVVLIPVLAVLKGLDTVLVHVIKELSNV